MPSANGHAPRRVVLYARVSTDEQARSGYSLAQQIEALKEYAAREGYEVLEEVVDPERAARALRGQVWTVCVTSLLPGASMWCWHRTAMVRPRARIPLPAAAGVRGARDEDTGHERPRGRKPRRGAH